MVEKIQTHLYAGQTTEAAAGANIRLTQTPDDDQARFALGAVQFLQAVEHLGQSLHRYGLRSGQYHAGGGLLNLPILRIPVPENPNPQELTYDTFRDVLQTFVSELQTAETTLNKIGDQQIALPLNIGLIRLDLNSDGIGSEDEALWQIFKVVGSVGRLNEDAARKLLTDFDFSDVAWLQAYCHLLMAIAEFPLAHNWSNAFEVTFPSLFYMPSSPNHKILQSYIETQTKLKKIGEMKQPKKPAGMTWPEWRKNSEYKEYWSLWKLHRRIWRTGLADAIAFIHLTNWPVVEPIRMRKVLEHLDSMVRLSRENWKRIVAETDYSMEWIPNLNQTGVLPRMQVTKERIDGWQQFLNEFEAILRGKKLIPHWRFDEGINVRRIFLEPRTFDLVLLIHGSAALPYLEKGDLTADSTWDQIQNLFGGDFLRYFMWFN